MTEDIIFKRRSIRLFQNKEIPDEILHYILRAGMWAPSPKNRQPWKMIVVKGNAKKKCLPAWKKALPGRKREKALFPERLLIFPMQSTR